MTDDELYDNIIREEQQGALARSAVIAHNTDPDRYAANRKEAQSLGLPATLAKPAKKPTNVNQMTIAANNFNSLLDRAPQTAYFLINPENAKLAHDNTDNMAIWENFIKPFAKATPRVLAHTAASMVQMPISGVAALAKLVTSGGDLDAANKVLEENQRALDEYYLTTEEERQASANINLAMKPFEMAGKGLAGLAELPTGGVEGAVDVVKGRSPGSNIFVPIMGTIGEGAAMFSVGELHKVAKSKAATLKILMDKAKGVKLAERAPDVAKQYFKATTEDIPPVKIPVEKFNEILADTGKAPEDILEVPEDYYRTSLNGEPLEIPVADIMAAAKDIKPDHINEMSIGGTPSVAEMEIKLEREKANGKESKGAENANETQRREVQVNGEEGGTVPPSPEAKVQPQGEFGSQAGGNAPEAGSLAFGMDLPKYAGSVNLERVNAEYPVKKLILDTADRYKGQIDEARRGTITHEETKALADELGMTVEDLLKRNKGEAFNAEQVTAARDILNTSATRLRQIQEAAAQIGSDEALLEFRKALDLHAAIQAEVSGASTEAGRALSAHRIASQPSKNYKAMLDALGGRELNEGILKRFAEVDTTNIAEVNRFIKEFAKVKKASMLYEAWIAFLLSGLKTHVVNMSSNIATFASKISETLSVAGVEVVRAKAAGLPRERFAAEAIQELIGAKAGIADGVTAALKAWREELPADTLVKFDSPSPYGGAIPGKTGKFIRGPLRALSAADEFMKSVVYTGEIYGQAYRQARIEGFKGDALNKRMAEIITNPSEKLREIAQHEAEYRTFNQPLGPYAKKINALRDLPGAKVIVPFFRTLTNIAKFGLERTPLNFARLAYKIKKGEISGAEISDELAKPILGTLIAASVVELASEGMITGGGPKDKNARATLLRTGWQPYSIKIADRYIPYGRLEPIGTVFGMSADFVEIANKGETDEKTLTDYAEAISLSFSKNLLSKTFVTGVSNALDAVQDPRRYGEQWINALAGSLVPSISANVAQVVDPNVRVTDTPLERMQSRLPYLSEALMPKRDIWGREIVRPGNAAERALSPSPVTTDTADPVDAELARLGMTIGLPSKDVTVDKKKVRMSPLQYDLYVQRSGERAYDEISQIIGSAMDDEEMKDAIEKIVRTVRAEERKAIIEEIELSDEGGR